MFDNTRWIRMVWFFLAVGSTQGLERLVGTSWESDWSMARCGLHPLHCFRGAGHDECSHRKPGPIQYFWMFLDVSGCFWMFLDVSLVLSVFGAVWRLVFKTRQSRNSCPFSGFVEHFWGSANGFRLIVRNFRWVGFAINASRWGKGGKTAASRAFLATWLQLVWGPAVKLDCIGNWIAAKIAVVLCRFGDPYSCSSSKSLKAAMTREIRARPRNVDAGHDGLVCWEDHWDMQ